MLTNQIYYASRIGLIGSCFVENMGQKLEYFKFKNWINPYGIMFNPVAIEKALFDIYTSKVYTKKDLVFNNERWHSLHHHSEFSDKDAEKVVNKINQNIKLTREQLIETTHLIITLGTAWVYRHISKDVLVANCHKIPQKEFSKGILSVKEITISLDKSIAFVKELNPEVEVILTLSPVRHLKEGMIANSQSKAQLLTAIHQIIDGESIHYFPSYELTIDDLRDYRFFTKDMLHPNETAIEYIWKVFNATWIHANTISTMKDVDYVQKGLTHRPFNADSEQYQNFLKKIGVKKKELLKEFGIIF